MKLLCLTTSTPAARARVKGPESVQSRYEGVRSWSGDERGGRTHGLLLLRESERRMPARRGAGGRKRKRASPVRCVGEEEEQEKEVRTGKEELAKRQRAFLRRRAFQSGPALPFRLLRKPVPPIKARELDLSLGATGRRDPPEVVPYDLSFWTFRCRASAPHLAGCRHASAFVSQSRALGRCVHMNQKKVTYGLLTVADVSDWQRTKKRQVVDRKKPVR